MLKPSTIEQLKSVRDALVAEETEIRGAIESIEGLLRTFHVDEMPPHQRCAICQDPTHRAPTCPKAPKSERLATRPKRRCRLCRATDHLGDKCRLNPGNAKPPVAPAVTDTRVCAVHEEPVTPLGKPKPNGRQTYTCPSGCQTENTIVRRAGA